MAKTAHPYDSSEKKEKREMTTGLCQDID